MHDWLASGLSLLSGGRHLSRKTVLLRCSKSAAYGGLSGLLTDLSRTVDIDPERPTTVQQKERPTYIKAKPSALKLSFDICLIYHRPNLANLLATEFVKDILGEGYSRPVYMEPKEDPLWRAVEG